MDLTKLVDVQDIGCCLEALNMDVPPKDFEKLVHALGGEERMYGLVTQLAEMIAKPGSNVRWLLSIHSALCVAAGCLSGASRPIAGTPLKKNRHRRR